MNYVLLEKSLNHLKNLFSIEDKTDSSLVGEGSGIRFFPKVNGVNSYVNIAYSRQNETIKKPD